MGRQVRDGLDGYKETEIGLLPEDWDLIRLGDAVGLRRESIHPSDARGMLYVGLEHIDSGIPKLTRWGSSNEVKSAKKIFYPGDILYGKLRPYLDKAVIVHWKGICSTDILPLEPRENIASEFLVYLLHEERFVKHAVSTTSGTNHPRTSWSSLARFLTPLPPFSEQRKIAHVLSTIQRAVEQQDKIIAAARELKKSLMRHLFTYGPVPVDQVDRVPLKETEIGLMTEYWEVVRLGDCLSIIRNGITKKQNKEGRGYPVTRIETIGDEKINALKIGWVDQLSEKEREKFQIRKNDILFSHINSELHLGKAAIYKGQPSVLFHGMNLLLIRTNKEILNPDFLFHLFKYYRTQGTFVGIASRAVNQSSINQGKMKALLIPLPPLSEQRQIARILSTVDKKIEVEEKRKASLQSLFQTMLHLLMTGRVRVKDLEVNVRDAGL